MKEGRRKSLELGTSEDERSAEDSSSTAEVTSSVRDSKSEEASFLEAMGVNLIGPAIEDGGSIKETLSDEKIEGVLITDLSKEERKEFKVMLRKHSPPFISDYKQIKGVTMVEHQVNLNQECKPIAQNLRRLGRLQQDALLTKVKRLLQAGFIYPEYASLQKYRRESFLSQREKELRRTHKEHHLDLRTDGSIYPKDPTTNVPPPFANITNLLHFTGDGKDGLLGYTEHLEMIGLNAERQINFLAMENMQLKKLNEACSQKILSNRETIQGLEKKITSLREKDTMLGSRKRKRDLCNIENMKIGSGGLKKRIRALRSLLHPNSNGAGCNVGVHYSGLVLKEVVEEMITQQKFCKLKGRLITSFMNENRLEPMEVQAILDESGILQMGYSALFKALAKKSQNKLQRGSLLPKPSHVKAARRHVNKEVFEKLGSPFHIKATFLGKGGRKLDECKVLKNKKLERVTITLMNRDLDPSITKEDPRYFSVQSEDNILTLRSFQVDKENFEILDWIFSQTLNSFYYQQIKKQSHSFSGRIW
ncbi:hypothetical protein L7F22_005635 [Adiantum nelumboides]|nr:hypothetical protein [Adiantum nelumboides]